MSSTTERLKKASFFQAVILRDGAKEYPPPRDWNTDLKDLAAKTKLKERKIDNRLFDPVEVNGQYLLGIHRPFNTDFMTSIDEDASSVTDLLEGDTTAAARFAQSSAVLFTNHFHIFAMALGHQHAPRHTAVKAFLTEYFPPGEGAHWEIEPFMDRAQIKRLQAADGLIEFSTSFSTQQDLFTSDDGPKGVVAMAEALAVEIGTDLDIKIQVTLPAESRGKGRLKQMLNVFKRDLSRTTGKDSRAKARAVISEGVEEELSLVAHKLAEEFELPELGSERKQFSNLLAGLQAVSAMMDDKVKEIIER